LYWIPTCWAICSAPAVPPVVGAQFDQFFTPLSLEPLFGATMNRTTPASAARPTAMSAPVRKWKRGANVECFAAATGSAAPPPRRRAGSRSSRSSSRSSTTSASTTTSSGTGAAGSSDAGSYRGWVPAGSWG
jgi:hypothetical protein